MLVLLVCDKGSILIFVQNIKKIRLLEATVKPFITFEVELLRTDHDFVSLFYLKKRLVPPRLYFHFNFTEASLNAGWDSTIYD